MKKIPLEELAFWIVILSAPLAGAVIFIGATSYWSIAPSLHGQIEGDPIVVYDPEIGFVPRPNSSSVSTGFAPNGMPVLRYDLYTDSRGARVSRPGEQIPGQIDVLFIGDSFTWGHGVQNEQTFAAKTANALGLAGANLAMGSYGGTQALQMLRRNRDLRPKLVIFGITSDTPRRNISACAPSYFPFCLDYSHVAWDNDGRPYIARPRSNGVRREELQVQAQRAGLSPLTWLSHGIDVAVSQIISQAAQQASLDKSKQTEAFSYLLEQMVLTTTDMKATLLIPYIPDQSALPPPEVLPRLAHRLPYRFLDLSDSFARSKSEALFIPHDGHPSAAGHSITAVELISFIRREAPIAAAWPAPDK
jgi:hypothetical protein